MSSERSRDRGGPGLSAEPAPNRGYAYRERLDERCRGVTLLDYLTSRYRHSTKAEWRERIAEGRIEIDGEAVTVPARPLTPREVLVWRRPPWQEPPGPSTIGLLYADGDVLGVAKPRGLPTMPGGGFLEKTLLYRLRRLFPGASPLHRLGRGTSGVVLCSRNARSRRHFTAAWPRVTRRYLGLVDGRFPDGLHRVELPIGRAPHPVLGTIAAVAPDGKRALSVVRLIEARETTSLVEIRIHTGRTHQIRIHLAAAGHPLAGDPLYPPGGIPDPGNDTLPGEMGFWLHAQKIELDRLTVECAPPPPLRERGQRGE